MSAEVQQILIVTGGVAAVVILALILGRRIKMSWGNRSLEAGREGTRQSLSATRDGSIKNVRQEVTGSGMADQSMTARRGTIEDADQIAGGDPDRTQP